MSQKTAPAVNHLLFTDANLMFIKSSREGAEEDSHLLDVYCNALGQRVNLDKSSIFFNKGCRQSVRDDVKVVLNVHNESLNESILGCHQRLVGQRMVLSNTSRT